MTILFFQIGQFKEVLTQIQSFKRRVVGVVDNKTLFMPSSSSAHLCLLVALLDVLLCTLRRLLVAASVCLRMQLGMAYVLFLFFMFLSCQTNSTEAKQRG